MEEMSVNVAKLVEQEFEKSISTLANVIPQQPQVIFSFPAGSTPMTVADAVIRECADKEWLEDVVYFINAYLLRTCDAPCDNSESLLNTQGDN